MLNKLRGFGRWRLITHTDLDGAGCAVLVHLAAERAGARLEVVHARTPTDVDALLTEWGVGTAALEEPVLVTDLRCGADLLRREPLLMVVDHHRSAVELDALPNAAVHVDRADGVQTCATELLHTLLVNAGLVDPRPFFVDMVRLYDTWAWRALAPLRLPAYLSALAYTLGVDEFEHRMHARLRGGDVDELTLLTAEEAALVHAVGVADNRFVTDRLQSVRISTEGGLRVGVVFADRCQSELGHRGCTLLDVDVVAVVDPSAGTVNLRTDRPDLDLSDLARRRFAGGGHAAAAGGTLGRTVAEELEAVQRHVAAQVGAWWAGGEGR